MTTKLRLFVSCLVASVFSVAVLGQSVSDENLQDKIDIGNFVSPSDIAMFRSVPQDLKSLISDSDTVIIGEVEGVERRFEFYGYDEEAAAQYRAMEATTPFKLGTSVVEYTIKVEKVVMDSTGNVSDVVTLRLMDIGKPLPNEKFMFFLTLSPDEKTYGITTSMDIIKMKDQNLRFEHLGEEYDINFTKGLSASQFEANVSSKLSEMCRGNSQEFKFCR